MAKPVSVVYDYRQSKEKGAISVEYVALVAIIGTIKLVLYDLVKSLQLICKLGTHKFYLWVPHLQMGCSDVIKMGVYRNSDTSNGCQVTFPTIK